MVHELRVCSVEEASKALHKKDFCQVVDVREASELESEHIAGAAHAPLSQFDKYARSLDKNKTLYLMCRTGARARDAAARLERLGFNKVLVVEGGIHEWIESGRPVVRGKAKIWSIERQVRFAAGLLVLTGVVASHFIHPAFIYLSVLVAAGLLFSAVTDTCGMAMVLIKMPWNKS